MQISNSKVFQIAGDQKLHELQEIIQANIDPFSIIFGTEGDATSSTIEIFDAYANEQDPKKKEKLGKLYKLLLILNTFDMKLMKKAVKNLEK